MRRELWSNSLRFHDLSLRHVPRFAPRALSNPVRFLRETKCLTGVRSFRSDKAERAPINVE
jgi:hypothetical protein